MQNKDTESVGSRIKNLRQSRGYSVTDLADMLNISAHHLYEVEAGRRMISLDVCINLSNIFNVSIDYIIIGNVHLSDKKIISDELDKLMDAVQKIRDMIL